MKSHDQFRNPHNEKGFVVVLARSGKRVQVPPGSSILAALLAEGIEVPYNCGDGKCGVCEVRVLQGQPDHRHAALSSGKETGLGVVLACRSTSLSEELVLEL